MGVLDKFLDIMKLSDDDDDYENDDFFDDDYDDDDYDDRSSKKSGILSKFNRAKDSGRDRDDDYDDYDDDYDERSARPSSSRASHQPAGSSKVTPMRQPSSRRQAPNMEVCVIKPSSVEDAREITETLLSGRTVILNLEGLDMEVAQRIIDFTSGSCYSIGGSLQKVSSYIFILTPASVDITGDYQQILSGAFDIPSIRTEY